MQTHIQMHHYQIGSAMSTTSNQDLSDSSDGDVLRAVLEFVESFDGGHTLVHNAATQHAQARKQKRHSSERTKSEIRSLKALAVQLEDRVARLQYERMSRNATAARNASVPGLWEMEALRQEEQRLQAEMENLELKQLVQAKAAVAQRLQVLFRRYVEREGADTSEGLRGSFKAVMGDHVGDALDPISVTADSESLDEQKTTAWSDLGDRTS
jgi:hypothetical protein